MLKSLLILLLFVAIIATAGFAILNTVFSRRLLFDSFSLSQPLVLNYTL